MSKGNNKRITDYFAGESHDLAYIREYDRVCGEAVMLAIQDKDRFEKLTKGVNDD